MTEIQKLRQEAASAFDRKEYAVAEKALRRALELMESQSSDPAQLAAPLEALANIHFQQAKFDDAAKEYERVLNMRERMAGNDDPRTLRLLYWLGKSHFNAEEYESAEDVFRKALSISEKKPEISENVTGFLRELGFLLYFVGRYQEAESYLLRALTLLEATLGPTGSRTAWVLGKLALTYRSCPDIGKDPEPYFRRAVEASETDPKNELEYAGNLCRWADCLAERNEVQGAEEVYGRLAVILNAAAKPTSEWHWMLKSCVNFFQSRGKPELVANLFVVEAEYDAYDDSIRQKLEHAERTLSDDDPQYADGFFNAGNLAIYQQKYAEAEGLLQRALDANVKAHGSDSEAVVANLNRLSVVARELGKLNESESTVQRALTIAEKHFPDSHVYPRTLETFAILREVQQRITDATTLYQAAVEAFQRQDGYPSYDTIECIYRQSGQLLRIGNFAAAETAIRRATDKMAEVDLISDYERADYMSTLASALEGLDRKSEAEEANKQSAELMERARKSAGV